MLINSNKFDTKKCCLNGSSSVQIMLTCSTRENVIPAQQRPITPKPPIISGLLPSRSIVKHCGKTGVHQYSINISLIVKQIIWNTNSAIKRGHIFPSLQ